MKPVFMPLCAEIALQQRVVVLHHDLAELDRRDPKIVAVLREIGRAARAPASPCRAPSCIGSGPADRSGWSSASASCRGAADSAFMRAAKASLAAADRLATAMAMSFADFTIMIFSASSRVSSSAGLEAHLARRLGGGVRGHRDRRIHRDLAGRERPEHDVGGHQLRRGGRKPGPQRVVVIEHPAGLGVDQDVGAIRVARQLSCRPAGRRKRQKGQNGSRRPQECHRSCRLQAVPLSTAPL